MVTKLGLCKGRHDIPQVERYVFDTIDDPTDVGYLHNVAYDVIAGLDTNKIHLYVTGLTVALVEVINVCRELECELTLYHFDRDTNSYFPQNVLLWD